MRTKYSKQNRLNVITLGCSKNIYDSEVLIEQLSQSNIPVNHKNEESNPNIVLVNTCGFIDNAKDTYLRIEDFNNVKITKPDHF